MAIIIMEIPGVNSVTTPITKATGWRVGTVTHIRSEAPGLRSYTFSFDGPVQHAAGQHYEIRLTAADGYQAARLYSAAMPANGSSNTLQLTIALMPNGEVSPYIFNHVRTGSQLEIRGPLGRYFMWTPEVTEPVLLVGGGSGVVPLRAMRIEHQHCCSDVPMRLLYSVKTYHDMAYKYELFPPHGDPPEDVIMTFTERAPKEWKGYARRIDTAMVHEALHSFPVTPCAYVCGPTPMVEAVTQLLVQAGLDPATIKAERFGSTA
jgi:ferredoxin-NADP reductase